jgi:PAS domain S-box-containing protein
MRRKEGKIVEILLSVSTRDEIIDSMAAQLNSRLKASLVWGAYAAILATTALGTIVLAGWLLNIQMLKRGFVGSTAMQPNAAIGLILCAVALWTLHIQRTQRSLRVFGIVSGALAALLGALTLGEYVLGRDFGIDQLLFNDPQPMPGIAFPGRMSPASALNLLFLAAAILLMNHRWRNGLSEALTIATLFSAGVGIVGHIYRVTAFYQINVYASLALHTALAFVLLALGIILSRPEYKLVTIFANEGPAGLLARRLLPAAIAIPILLGWLALAARRAGIFDVTMGTAIYALANVVVFSALIWLSAQALLGVETHRVRAEKALHASESRFRALFDTMGEGLSLNEIICDESGKPYDMRYLEVNPAFERLTGLKAADIVGRTSLELFPDTEPIWFERYGRAALEGKSVQFDAPFGPLGRWFQIQAYQTEPGRFAMIFFDISERRLAEEKIKKLNEELEERVALRTLQLESANRELEAFSYSVSHDLRSPLRSIDGFSQAILEDYQDLLPDEGKQYLSRIRGAAQRMATLIDDMLSLSRVTRVPMRSVPVNLSDLAREVCADLQKNFPDRQVHLTIAPDMLVYGDPNLLKVVLENLLGNAWKFTSRQPRPEIQVGMKIKNEDTIYFVRDNGAGFDMAYADKLFGAFQRLHAMTDFPGTGVGLATVQRIIHRHGGRIWAEAAVDKGATFFFTLPAIEQLKSERPAELADPISSRAKKII